MTLCGYCYGGKWDVRRADPLQAYLQDVVSKKSNRYNTGKTKNIPAASVGLQSANNIQRAWHEG